MTKALGIFLTWGKPGMGKSLDQARTALKLFEQYKKIQKRYPQLPHRSIWSNQKFSEKIEAEHLNKDLFYWENPRQLKDLRDVDILWDEIGRDLPADGWSNTPKWLRQVFSHYRKRGNRIFANTQDYKACDINFRRQIKEAWRVKKLMGNRDISVTMPAVKFIWGVIQKQQFDPTAVEKLGGDLPEGDDEITGKSRIFFIRRKLVEAYDTAHEIPAYMPDRLEHIEMFCETCGKYSREGRKVVHRPI